MSIKLKDTIYDLINNSDKLDGIDSTSFAKTVKVGNTSYNANSSIISLPSYPTIPTIPTTLPNPKSLTIQANGTSLGSYDGSSALSVDITYSNVGAAKSDHTHSQYLNTTTTRAKNTILAGPGSGSNAVPTFRTLVAADIPSHNHSADNITSGTLAVIRGGTGKTTLNDACNSFINSLSTGSSTPTDADYFISQYVGGGTTTTTYHRRPVSAIYTYIKGKLDSVYAAASHTHTKSQITDFSHTHNYAGSSSAGGVATSAEKLSTARYLWGNLFDGSSNIAGTITIAGNNDYRATISMIDGYLYLQPRRENVTYNINTVINSNGGNVGIGTTSPAYKLDVSDTMQVTSYITGLFINRTNPEGNPHVSFKSNGTLVGDIGFTPQKNLVFYDYNSGSWKDVLNANNYTSYTVTKTGGGASGTWGINVSGWSGSAGSAGYLYNAGNPSNLNSPSTWSDDGARLVFDNYSGNASNKPISHDNANSLITLFKTKHGTTGQYTTQLAFPNRGEIYFRTSSAGTWSGWYRIYHSGNFSATGTTWDGGVVNNTIYTNATPGIIIRRDGGSVPYIRFGTTSGTNYGELGADSWGNPVWWYSAGENAAWRTLVTNVSGTAYNSTRWGGYSISVGSSAGTDSNTIYFVV